MDLKKFLPGSREDKPVNYWVIAIEPGWIEAGIWTIQDNSAKVVYFGTTTPWELDDELNNSVDTALSAAIKGFPENVEEPTKTVFGLTSEWVSGGDIKPEYLDKLKKLCVELSLTPIGFVVIPEAFAHFYKSKEDTPLNAVLVGIYATTIETSIFSNGNLLGTVNVGRSVSLSDDLVEGISRFSLNGPAPSRLIVYDGKDMELEDLRQELLKTEWEEYKDVKFLHTPKVEIIDSHTKVEAVALAGASEIAGIKTVANSVTEEVKEEKQQEVISDEPEFSEVEIEEVSGTEGFVVGEDITQLNKEVKLDDSKDIDIDNSIKPELKGYDNLSEVNTTDTGNIASPQPKVSSKPKFKLNFKKYLTGFLGFGSFFNKAKPTFGTLAGNAGSGKKPLILGVVTLLVVVIVGFIAWWVLPKANLAIYVSSMSLPEKLEVKLDPDAETNIEGRVIKAREVTESVTGERTKSTTGTKTVGDRAVGEISIYRVGPNLSLQSGMLVHGPSSLNFTLDDSVTLASGSASSPSITKVKVTASSIGAEYNLAAGTSFTINNFSSADLEAKNESSFSGGSSREINAVAKEDLQELENELTRELTESYIGQVRENLGEDEFLIENSLAIDDKDLNYSNKVGDEASVLKLEQKLEATVLVVSRKELVDLSQKILEGKVPDGYVLRGDQIVTELTKNNDSDNYELTITANLLPKLEIEEIKKNIRGKYPPLAKDYLVREIPGFVRAEISLKPALPGRLGTLPRLTKNIDIEIASDK